SPPGATWWVDHPDKPAAEEAVIRQPSWRDLLKTRPVALAGAGSMLLIVAMVAAALALNRSETAPPSIDLASAVVAAELMPSEVVMRDARIPYETEMPVDAVLDQIPEVVDEAPAVVEKPAAVEPKPAPKVERIAIKRRDRSSDEDLRKQLLKVQELT